MAIDDKYVDSFNKRLTGWAEVPAVNGSVYLDNDDSDYFSSATANVTEGDFGFPASGGSGVINSVKLRFEEKIANAAGGNGHHIIDTNGDVDLADIFCGTVAYSWFEVDVSARFDTWAKINAMQFYVKLIRFDAWAITLRRCIRRVDYTPPSGVLLRMKRGIGL